MNDLKWLRYKKDMLLDCRESLSKLTKSLYGMNNCYNTYKKDLNNLETLSTNLFKDWLKIDCSIKKLLDK